MQLQTIYFTCCKQYSLSCAHVPYKTNYNYFKWVVFVENNSRSLDPGSIEDTNDEEDIFLSI